MNEGLRKNTLYILFISIGVIFLIRLFSLQVVDDSLKEEAANMSERRITIYPSRGLITDRNNNLLVANTPVYDLLVTPVQIGSIDTTVFCQITGITKETFIQKIEKAKEYSYQKPSVFIKQIPSADYAQIAEQLYRFPGFFAQSRTLRSYPLSVAAHTVGYIGEVSPTILERDKYYRRGDYIGTNGLEKNYEEQLRGKRGVKYVLVDVHNNEKGSYQQGTLDKQSQSGKDLKTTIDAHLQAYGEKLMNNKKGSVVVLEPATGEVLALVSEPSYDPNLLIGRIRNKNYVKLLQDTLKPLFNRSIMARYPPGSTFKLINALIGLQEGVLSEHTTYSCHQGYYYANKKLGCHPHASPLQLLYSIQTSCNAYYCNVFRSILEKYPTPKEGLSIWQKYLREFGLGEKMGVDIPNETSGLTPSPELYDRMYGENRWNPHTVISLSIGQGEIGITPLQMANLCATIANRGYYVSPHIVKSVGKEEINVESKHHKIHIDSSYFELVIEGMRRVVKNGTGRGVDFSPEIPICGKTGTAENPHGEDHSIFIAFAPKENPKIALAVYVENVGFGSTWAAPIASLMIEKYLKGEVSRKHVEERIVNANLLQ